MYLVYQAVYQVYQAVYQVYQVHQAVYQVHQAVQSELWCPQDTLRAHCPVYCTQCAKRRVQGMMSWDQCILLCPCQCEVYTYCALDGAGRGSDIRAFLRAFHYPPMPPLQKAYHYPYHLASENAIVRQKSMLFCKVCCWFLKLIV